MITRWVVCVTLALSAFLAAGCTGGKEGHAAEEQTPKKNPIATRVLSRPVVAQVDAKKDLLEISPAIPLYAGAQYRDDLTRRDEVMIRNQYGPHARVYTLATNDSFPQVYHYYATYLAQFRSFPAHNPYPPAQQNWRTLEVRLNDAMQDPFIPGNVIPPGGSQVLLQVAETEAEPKTVIRYIVVPGSAPAAQLAARNAQSPAAPVPAPATHPAASAVR